MDGFELYDKLSEVYGIQDNIKSIIQGDIARSKALLYHNKAIREIKELLMRFSDFQDQDHGFSVSEQIYAWQYYSKTYCKSNTYKECMGVLGKPIGYYVRKYYY